MYRACAGFLLRSHSFEIDSLEVKTRMEWVLFKQAVSLFRLLPDLDRQFVIAFPEFVRGA
jgi:hypothetical protein